MHDDSDDEHDAQELFVREKSLREMVRDMKPGDRWPYEPPAPDLGPDSGVREPVRPTPIAGGGAAKVQPEAPQE